MQQVRPGVDRVIAGARDLLWQRNTGIESVFTQ
jgi:hypothetical protein